MKISHFYFFLSWGMLPAFLLLGWALEKTRVGRWFNQRHRLVQASLILIIGFGLMVPMAYCSNLGQYYEHLEKYRAHFYGKVLIFDRYIQMPTPDPGDAVAFRDSQGIEHRIWCNDYLRGPNALDLAYMRLKPGQLIRFSTTGYGDGWDQRPIPIALSESL